MFAKLLIKLGLKQKPRKKTTYADDDTESIGYLFKLRAPSLIAGLGLGVLLSLATSRFEWILQKHIEVVYFIPLIVYMADAVGTQTQAIYTRDLKTGHASFFTYLLKESALGVLIGLAAGAATSVFVWLWYDSFLLSLSVGLATLGAIVSAPLIALLVTEVLQLEHQDPAVGAGPIATVIQDAVSILIYGWIASWVYYVGTF